MNQTKTVRSGTQLKEIRTELHSKGFEPVYADFTKETWVNQSNEVVEIIKQYN